MKALTVTTARLRGAEIAFWLLLGATSFFMPDKLALLSQILIIGLFAVSLDIALGYAGILTVGHAAFFGAGAYAAGLLAKHGWGDPTLGLAVALLSCAALGQALSILVVRGTDLARLLITIGVCVLFAELVNRLAPITGGTDGLQGMVVAPVLGVFDFDLSGRTAFWYAYGVVLVLFLLVRLMLRSPFGLVLRGIHDNPKRMLAIGSPVEARLRLAYCFSAAVAGVAGALFAQTTQFVGIESIGFNRSAEILIILVLGGTGRLYGGLVGAVIYLLIHDAFAELNPQYWMFWLGAFLIAAVLLGRGGVMGLLSRLVRTDQSVMADHALRATDVSLRFGAFRAVDGLSLSLEPGARQALIGPNGAGKTTLINVLTGVYRPTAGTIHLGDQDITALRCDQRARMGLVRTFQINTLFPNLTPLQSVVLAMAEREGLGGTWWRALKRCTALHDEAHALLARLRLDSVAEVRVSELAYGKQRLLEMALALAARPRILLLDEPAAGIPERESTELFEAIAELPEDISVLFIEHDMNLVFRFSRRISVLVAGRIVAEGTPAQIGADPLVREVYLGHAGARHD